MNYNDDNRIRRKKVSSNDYNYKSKQHQRYYEEKVRLDNVGYENKIENNKIKRDNINKSSRAKKRKKAKKKMRFKIIKCIFEYFIDCINWNISNWIISCNIIFKRYKSYK